MVGVWPLKMVCCWRFEMAGFLGVVDEIGISVIGDNWLCGGCSWLGVGLLKIVGV